MISVKTGNQTVRSDRVSRQLTLSLASHQQPWDPELPSSSYKRDQNDALQGGNAAISLPGTSLCVSACLRLCLAQYLSKGKEDDVDNVQFIVQNIFL